MAYRPGGVPLGGDRFDRSDIIQVPGGPAPWGQVVRRDDSDDEVDLGSTVSAAGTRFHFGDFDVDSVCQSRAGKIGGGCCCCLFLVLLIMLLSSFKGLHATHFGILRNSLTGVVSYGATYQGGRNFIGFWNDYLIFPATIQSIEWLPGVPQMSSIRDLSPMNVRTADGLMVELGIVTQYQVVRDKIPDIYQTYKTDYEGFFISNLRSALQATVAEFKATELYTKRPQVAESLEKTCRKVCQENLQGFLTCWGIQLLTVSLDPRIESANVQQQVEMQKQATESMKQKAGEAGECGGGCRRCEHHQEGKGGCRVQLAAGPRRRFDDHPEHCEEWLCTSQQPRAPAILGIQCIDREYGWSHDLRRLCFGDRLRQRRQQQDEELPRALKVKHARSSSRNGRPMEGKVFALRSAIEVGPKLPSSFLSTFQRIHFPYES
ncbi:unnamed protein product [Durusdinium trenchii]|uniref:Band 7 domain-containing protein n=1 Tax=Durusdinium trenchii TaxID=1381693 RepID=A0ABP0PY94_9DINO